VNVAEQERYTVTGGQIVEKIKQLIREGNIRRVRLLHDGKVVIEIPLSVGGAAVAAGIIWAPVLAAIGAFAALATECTIEVEKIDKT
jgi:hypothetical protein